MSVDTPKRSNLIPWTAYLITAWPVLLFTLVYSYLLVAPGLAHSQLLDYYGDLASTLISPSPELSTLSIKISQLVMTAISVFWLSSSVRYWVLVLTPPLESPRFDYFTTVASITPIAATLALLYESVLHFLPALSLMSSILLFSIFLAATRFFSRRQPLGRSFFSALPSILIILMVSTLSVIPPNDATEFDGSLFSTLCAPVALLAIFTAGSMNIFCSVIRTGRIHRLPFFVLLVTVPFAITMFSDNDNHKIRTVMIATRRSNYWTSLPIMTARELYSSTTPIIIVSAEGGGIRAAYFTAMTLAKIADYCPTAANNILVVSGVSGGAVGASVYAAIVHKYPINRSLHNCDFSGSSNNLFYERKANDILGQDYLSPVLSRLLFADSLQTILPWPATMLDRQLGLEYTLEKSTYRALDAHIMDQPLSAIAPSMVHWSTPYLLLNATSVTTGEHYVTSQSPDLTNVVLGASTLLPVDRDLTVASAAGMSARFTFVSPSGYIDKITPFERNRLYFVDGGYYDNTGILTLRSFYENLFTDGSHDRPNIGMRQVDQTTFGEFGMVMETNHEHRTVHARTRPVVVLDIRTTPVCQFQEGPVPTSCIRREKSPGNILHDVTDPIRTFFSVRAKQDDSQWAQIGTVINLANKSRVDLVPDSWLTIQMTKGDVEEPLGWFLSSVARQQLAAQLTVAASASCERSDKSIVRLGFGYKVSQKGRPTAYGNINNGCALLLLEEYITKIPNLKDAKHYAFGYEHLTERGHIVSGNVVGTGVRISMIKEQPVVRCIAFLRQTWLFYRTSDPSSCQTYTNGSEKTFPLRELSDPRYSGLHWVLTDEPR